MSTAYLSHEEAQLFRMLTAIFGHDNVIPRMRVIAVCEGEVPQALGHSSDELETWARNNTCLFTVVNNDGDPCMVMEFYSGFEHGVVVEEEVDHQRFLKPILKARGVHYVTISGEEFEMLLDPRSGVSIMDFLKDKFNITGSARGEGPSW